MSHSPKCREWSLFTPSPCVCEPEWVQLRADLTTVTAENERLQGLFQQVHGCHHSWVARGSDADRAERELATAETALSAALEAERIERADCAKAQARVKELESSLVTEAERKVLEACAAMTSEGIDAATGQSVSVDKALEAELARRGGTRG